MDIREIVEQLPRAGAWHPGAFLVLAGPCVVENWEVTYECASTLKRICDSLQLPFVFKASYRKANRSRSDSFEGIGDEKALGILKRIQEEVGVPIVTDIHTAEEAQRAAAVADILQIPAFLCRQTDLLRAAAATGRVVNIKKGQFVSPEAMGFAVEKVQQCGNDKVMLTDRGTMFGYQDLVVDFRGIPAMQAFHVPVILDVTHSLQRPNQGAGVTGGQPALIEYMARLGIAAGVEGIFFETHPDPAHALSDGANMLPLMRAEGMLHQLAAWRAFMTTQAKRG